MILTSLQAQTLINWFKRIDVNQTFQTEDVNYLLSPFEGNINPKDLT